MGVLLLIFDLAPGILDFLTDLLGITLPINMLFFLGIAFILMIMFSQTIVISNLTRKTKRLTQEIGMLNRRIDDLIEEREKEKGAGEASDRTEAENGAANVPQ